MITFFKSVSASISINTQTHFFTALLLESISGLQTIYLLLITIFPASIDKAFRFTELLKQITSVLSTGEILGPGTFSSSAIEVICYSFVGYLIVLGLFLILLLIRSYSQSNKMENSHFTRLISKTLRVHSRVIFFIAQYYFLKYLTNSSDKEIPSDEITWRWWLIIAYIGNIIITVLHEACFHQRAKIKDSYATNTNLFHQLVIAHKLIGLTVYFLASSLAESNMQTGTAVVHIVFTISALAILSVYLPFYCAKILKVSIFFTSWQFALTIVLIMSACDLKQETLEALCMIIPPLLVKILLVGFRWRSERILRGRPQTPQEAMHFAGLLKKLAFGPAHPSRHLRKIPKESLVSNGLLSNYGIDITKGVLVDTEKEYKQIVYLYILEVLEEVSMRYQDSIALSLYMAKVYLKRLNNESQALKLIMRMQARDLTLTENNSLKKFQNLMEELKHRSIQDSISSFDRYNKGGEKEDVDIHKIDIQSYFRAQEFADLIRKDMHQEVSNHLSFWQALKSDQLDVKTMFDMCQRIEALSLKLRKHYGEDLAHLQNYCCATIIMFAVYLHLIREIPEDSSLTKRFMRYLKDSSLRHPLDMYSNEVAVLVNSSQGASDLILSASGSLQTIFQIEGSRLIGKSINFLFPTVFAKQYIDYLYEYTKSLSSSESENKFKTFAKTASGHLFEVEVFFKVYPEISQEMKIMALLKALPSSHHLILLGHDGHILECDSQIAKELNIVTSDIGRLNLQKLCSTFNLVNKAFNSVYSNEWELGSRGTKRNQSQGLDIDKRATISLTQKFPTDALMSPKYPDNHPLISPKSPTETMPMMMMTYPNTETLINFKTIIPTQNDDTLRTEQSERQNTQKAGFDKAKGICEAYMKGKKLTFLEYNSETDDKGGLKETEYDVKIEPHVLDGRVYKLLRLENAQLVKEKPLLSEVAKSITLKLKSQKTFQQLSQRRSSQASSIETSNHHNRNPIIEIVEKEKKESAAALVTRLQRTLMNSLEYQEGGEPEAPNELEIFPEMLSPEITMNKSRIVRKQQDIIDSSLDSSRASQDKVVLAHKVQQSQISSMHSSMISAKSARGRTMRALHQVLDAEKSYHVSFRALVVMYLIILGLLGLAIANYAYSLSSINQVQEELNANNLLNVRLCAAMSGWSALVRLLSRSTGWRVDTQTGITYIQNNVSLFTENLNSDNNNLQRLLANAKTKALFNRMLERDITFDLNMSSVTSEVGPLNSFIATDLLVNKYSEVTRLTYSEFFTAESAETISNAIVNGGNDYLVSSENIMKETKDMLSDVSSQSVLVLKFILIFVFVALALFLVAYLVILNSIVMKLKKLFQAIIRIEQNSIDKKILRFEQVKYLFEEDIQTDLFIANASNLLYQRRPRDKKQQEKLLRSSHKNIKTRSLVKLLAAYLLLAIILIMILCGFFIEGLINTISSFHSMDTINNQLSVLSKAQYQASALGGLFYLDIMDWNSTTFTFRRKSLKTQMKSTLSFFSGVNDNIKQTFSDSENDQVIEDLLNYKICGYLTSLTTTQCWAGTLNDTMNIQTLNTFFYTTSMYYYNLFIATPTQQTGMAIFLVFYRTMINYLNTLDSAYTFLTSHIIDNVNTTVSDFKSMKLVRFIIILVAILVCVIVIQNVTVKMFAHYDIGRGSILKIMGMDIVLESKALIYYLKSEFDQKGTILGSNAFK